VRRLGVEVHRVALVEGGVVAVDVHDESALQHVDELRPVVPMRLRGPRGLGKLDMERLDLAVGDGIVDELAPLAWRGA
jgi:hypothetical protein